MGYEQSVSSQKRLLGFLLVLAFHIVLIYALVNGLAQKIVKTVIDPLEVKIIEQVKLPPPPPPPPPPPKDVPPPPKEIKPPPAYVPPAEVKVESNNQDTIAAVTSKEPPPSAPIPAPMEPAKAAPEPPPPQHVAVKTKGALITTSCPKPKKSAESDDLEETGTVKLSFYVDTDGNVVDSKVIKSSGFSRLDETARQAISQCKFSPVTVDGVPEKTWINQEIEFN
jgi:periplasmic protein TonB